MIVKIKTAKQLIEEFGFKYDGYNYETYFNDMFWRINNLMFKYLGEEIEVEELTLSINYTHKGKISDTAWHWHELWFEPEFVPIEFIKENEFEL